MSSSPTKGCACLNPTRRASRPPLISSFSSLSSRACRTLVWEDQFGCSGGRSAVAVTDRLILTELRNERKGKFVEAVIPPPRRDESILAGGMLISSTQVAAKRRFRL